MHVLEESAKNVATSVKLTRMKTPTWEAGGWLVTAAAEEWLSHLIWFYSPCIIVTPSLLEKKQHLNGYLMVGLMLKESIITLQFSEIHT